MKLLIRSQDRTLLTEVDRIYICQATNNKDYDIIGNYCTLGTYKTMKRALEVLDEIQSCLAESFVFEGSYEELDLQIKSKMVSGLYGNIYVMPKE